jgi:hypothetical protein
MTIQCGPSFSPELLHTFQSQFEVGCRSLLRFLDECVQQNHPALSRAEQHSRDPAFCQIAAHFPQAAAQCPTQRHAYRPGKLNVLDVLSNSFPVFTVETFAATREPAHVPTTKRKRQPAAFSSAQQICINIGTHWQSAIEAAG